MSCPRRAARGAEGQCLPPAFCSGQGVCRWGPRDPRGRERWAGRGGVQGQVLGGSCAGAGAWCPEDPGGKYGSPAKAGSAAPIEEDKPRLGRAVSPAPSWPLAAGFPPGSSHSDPGATTRPFRFLHGGRTRGGAGACSRVSPRQVAISFVRLCPWRTRAHHTGAHKDRHLAPPDFPSVFTPA